MPAARMLTFPPTASVTLGVLDVVVSPFNGSLTTSTVTSMLTEPSTRIAGAGAEEAAASAAHLLLHSQHPEQRKEGSIVVVTNSVHE